MTLQSLTIAFVGVKVLVDSGLFLLLILKVYGR